MDLNELTRPLDISDIDFRVQSINNGGYATILAYKDARVDMARLDSAVGALGWQRKHEFINGKLFCHVGILSPTYGEFVWKSDVGTESMTEATKGESSDSFKRACFNWGIGRELYDYPVISVKLNDNEWSKDGGRPKQTYNLKIREWTWYSEFTDGRISFLAAKDENGKVRFKWGTMKPKEKEPEFKPASAPADQPHEEPQEVTQHTQPIAKDEDANIQGLLKKKEVEVDEEREALILDYTRVIGKKPDGRMKNETMKKAIEDQTLKIMEDNESVDIPDLINAPAGINLEFPEIQKHSSPSEFISWAKEVLSKYESWESEENIAMFKELCNNHYKKIAQ